MNADESSRGREVADLERMLPVPAERDLPAGRRHVIKEHLMTELRTDQPATHRAARVRRSRRTAWTAAGAGLHAAAAAAASAVGRTGEPAATGGAMPARERPRHSAQRAPPAHARGRNRRHVK